MSVTESMKISEIQTERSNRIDEVRVLTSCRAGQIIPLKYFPILREDMISSGRVRITAEMAETIHPLMNGVNVTAYVHFVPYTALDRFKDNGMNALNRSYQKINEPGTSAPIPYFMSHSYDRASVFWKTLGIHWKQGDPINSALIQTFKALVDFRRKARSESLPPWDPATGLPAAFWKNGDMMHIVPDYDQAAMDGEVKLTFADSKVPVRSKSFQLIDPGATKRAPLATEGFTPQFDGLGWFSWANEIFVELKANNVSVTLANIELAKQTAAFAKLRDQYSPQLADHIVDLLMEGISVPDEALKQPILLDKRSTIFGFSERHAMDGASLDKSVTTGRTELDLSFRLPKMNSGGIVWVSLEIVPEQLFERKRDKFLGLNDPSQLPNFMVDYLDPHKVDVIKNNYADVNHSTPSGVFGYAPLNSEWKRSFANIGGKFFRPTPDAFVEDRQRFWSVEQLNPTLTQDFYLVNNLPHSVFMDTLSDAFEILCTGQINVVGNTVFGKALTEDQDSYNIIDMQIDKSRPVIA